jgi:hypothetical protein
MEGASLVDEVRAFMQEAEDIADAYRRAQLRDDEEEYAQGEQQGEDFNVRFSAFALRAERTHAIPRRVADEAGAAATLVRRAVHGYPDPALKASAWREIASECEGINAVLDALP